MKKVKPKSGIINKRLLDLYHDIREIGARLDKIMRVHRETWNAINPTGTTKNFYSEASERDRFKNASEDMCREYPELKKSLDSLRDGFNKQRFSIFYGRTLEDAKHTIDSKDYEVKEKQIACLQLLQWQIEWLEREMVRVLIYQARENQAPADVNFLDGVAKAIQERPKMHGLKDKDFLKLAYTVYKKGMSYNDFVKAIEPNPDSDTYKKVRRLGISSKDF